MSVFLQTVKNEQSAGAMPANSPPQMYATYSQFMRTFSASSSSRQASKKFWLELAAILRPDQVWKNVKAKLRIVYSNVSQPFKSRGEITTLSNFEA